MALDPVRIMSWWKLVVAVLIALGSAGLWVMRSEAKDEDMDTRIVTNAKEIATVSAKVEQVQLSVDDIVKLLEEQVDAIEQKEAVAEAERVLIRGFCKDDTFRSDYDLQCKLSDMGG